MTSAPNGSAAPCLSRALRLCLCPSRLSSPLGGHYRSGSRPWLQGHGGYAVGRSPGNCGSMCCSLDFRLGMLRSTRQGSSLCCSPSYRVDPIRDGGKIGLLLSGSLGWGWSPRLASPRVLHAPEPVHGARFCATMVRGLDPLTVSHRCGALPEWLRVCTKSHTHMSN